MNGLSQYKRLIILFLALYYLTSCTGLVGKGDELFDSGLYHEAADLYERALNKDPNDVDAKIGLDKARHKIIDRGLIEVRMLRLSLNMAGASQKLEQILRNQSQWHLQLQGAITLTQSEETRYAKSWLLKQISQVSQSPHPDQFRWFRHSYSYLIANAQIDNILSKYNNEVNKKGLYNCESLAKFVEGQRFFLKDFAGKYCVFWGKEFKGKTDNIDRTRFNNLSINNQIRKKAKGVNLHASFSSLKESFQRNIWYSPMGSAKLNIKISGVIDHSTLLKRSKRRVQYTVEKIVKNPNTSDGNSIKKVKKIHVYYVLVHDERLAIDLSISSQIQSEVIHREVNYDFYHSSISHNEYFPLANLEPKQATPLNINQHTASQLAALNEKYISALTQKWENYYCDRNIHDPSGENVLRCGKIKPEHGYVNNWFKQKFGINYQQMAELYGL